MAVAIGITLQPTWAKEGNDTKWTKSTYEKLRRMEKLGFDKKLATYIIN